VKLKKVAELMAEGKTELKKDLPLEMLLGMGKTEKTELEGNLVCNCGGCGDRRA
jgi:hypothetical protein